MYKYEKIINELLEYINMLPPNSKIPSRRFIGSKWHISRATTDKVINELKRSGVLYGVKGSGTFISPKQEDNNVNLCKNGTINWAVLIPDILYDINPAAFRGIENFTKANNINLSIHITNDDPDTEYAVIQHLAASDIDGFIIVAALTNTGNIKNYRYLERMNIPFVFWMRSVDYMDNIPQLLFNGYYGGYIATKHLISMGYKRIAYIANKRFRSSMDRYMGYETALSEAGIQHDKSLVCIGINSPNGRDEIENMVYSENPPDAFVCYVDSLAIEVVLIIESAGLRVSDDVGIIGFEGSISWLDSKLPLKLTYVDINRIESGIAAARSLWHLMKHETPGELIQVFSPCLCIRESCLGKKSPHNTK